MRLLFTNELLTASLSSSDVSTNYPVNNLIAKSLTKRFQSTSTTSVVTGAWSADISANCFFYGDHNLTALTVVFKNSGGGTIGTEVITPAAGTQSHFFTLLTGIRSVEISVTGPDPVKVGGFALGVYKTYGNPLTNFKYEMDDLSIVTRSDNGQYNQSKNNPLNVGVYVIRENTLEIKNEFRDEYKEIGKGFPIWVDIFYNSHDTVPPMYCVFSKKPKFPKTDRRYRIEFELSEAR